MKKLTAFIELHKSLLTRGVILAFLLIALPLTIYLNSQNQDTRQKAAEGNLFCSFEPWRPAPDWLINNNRLGSAKLLYAPGDPDYEEKKDWVGPGPVIEAGSEVATTQYKKDGSIDWRVQNGAILPVRYNPAQDKIRYDFSSYTGTVSSWSRFLARVDGAHATFSTEIATNQISTGVILKYELMRLARDGAAVFIKQKTGEEWTTATQWDEQINRLMNSEYADDGITLQTLSENIGFDVTGLDLRKWDATDAALRKNNMLSETASCTAIPTPKPTSTTPVSCEEPLMIPPVTFKKDIPPFTPNICPAHIANRDPGTNRNELDVCGEYWVTQWCNGNQQNATYACRGWSQTTINPVLLYYTNRIHAITTTKGAEGDGGQLAANIAKYGDFRGRRITWNNFMKELKDGKIAYPWEHSSASKPADEVRNNALQAASTAIFGKPWSFILEQERMNNCSTTWDVQPTPSVSVPPISVTPSITPSVSPTPSEDDPITNDGEANKDINPKVYKDKSGNVHAVWLTQPESVKYSKGTWNGTRYTFSTPLIIGSGCASQGCAPSIAVNDDNVILIAWAGETTLKVFSWTQGTTPPASNIKEISQMGISLTPNIAIDKAGTFHIVADGDFKTKYCIYNLNGTCTSYTELDEASSKPEIAIDSEDNIHIVAGNQGVHYLTKKADQTTFTDTLLGSGNGQQITSDTTGNVYITWSQDFNIHYCKKTIDSTCSSNNTKIIQDGNGTNPSIGITDTGGIIIAYNTSGQRVTYTKYIDGTWEEPKIFGKQGAGGVDISPVSYDAKLSAVWSADWDIWHKNFSFGDGTAFDLTLLLDGIGEAGDYTNRTASDRSNKDPQHKNRSVAIQFFNEQDALVYTKIGTVSYNKESGAFKGIIPLGIDIAEGKYYTKVKMDQYLVKPLTFFIVRLGEVNVHPPLTLVSGDTDGNNELNLLDYNIIDGCYKDIKPNASSCDDELARLSDLNDDGKVNQLDYNLFVRELPAKKGQ